MADIADQNRYCPLILSVTNSQISAVGNHLSLVPCWSPLGARMVWAVLPAQRTRWLWDTVLPGGAPQRCWGGVWCHTKTEAVWVLLGFRPGQGHRHQRPEPSSATCPV